eukprot:m.54876 g.54876  ORF g.54876 m.54876 type:complete len:60 (-) comp21984_c0_seq1:193-372(-)
MASVTRSTCTDDDISGGSANSIDQTSTDTVAEIETVPSKHISSAKKPPTFSFNAASGGW